MGEHKNRPPFGASGPIPPIPQGGKDLAQLSQEMQQERIVKAALAAPQYGPNSSYLLRPMNGWILVEKLSAEEARGDSKVILPTEFPIYRVLEVGGAPYAANALSLWSEHNCPIPKDTLVVINGNPSLHMYRGENFMYIMYHQVQMVIEPKSTGNGALS